MMNKQQDIELIEQYLDNQLNEPDLTAFEAKLAADAELRASVDLQRHVRTELSNAAQIKLLNTLHEIVQTPFESTSENAGPRKPNSGWWIPGICILVAVAYLFYSALNPAVHQPQSQPAETPESDFQPAIPAPTQMPQAETPAQPARTTEPIAALNPADFQPNRILDPLVGSQVRSGGNIEATIVQPSKLLNLALQNGRISFIVKGNANADTPIEKDALQLLLFSNRDADFLNNKPIQKFPITLLSKENAYYFSKTVEQNMKPGLYYLVLAEKDSSEPLSVQKVRIIPSK